MNRIRVSYVREVIEGKKEGKTEGRGKIDKGTDKRSVKEEVREWKERGSARYLMIPS